MQVNMKWLMFVLTSHSFLSASLVLKQDMGFQYILRLGNPAEKEKIPFSRNPIKRMNAFHKKNGYDRKKLKRGQLLSELCKRYKQRKGLK